MRDFFRKSSWSFISVAVRGVSMLVINKIFAVNFGAPGITLLAHFQNLVSLITQIPNDGINRGIIKYWAGKELDHQEKHKMLTAGFLFNILLFLIAFLLLFIFRNYFFRDFNFQILTPDFFLILSLAVLLFIIHLFLLSVILSFQQIRAYSIIQILIAMMTVVVLYLIADRTALKYALLAFILVQSMGILLSAFIVGKNKLIVASGAIIPPEGFRRLGGFVMMALSVLIFGKLTDFVIRDYAMQKFGLHQAGLWQSVVKLSDGYMMAFVNTIGIVYYPKISALLLDRDQLKKYVRNVLKFVFIASFAGLLFIYLLRVSLLTLFFNVSFTPAEIFMPYQLTGDLFNILSFLLMYIISARALTKTFIYLQGGSAILYIGLVFLLCPINGIAGIPAAYAIRYLIFMLTLLYLNKRIIF